MLDEGFEYEGRRYKSLSAIVQALARAFSWVEVIESGEVKFISPERRGAGRPVAGQADQNLPGGLGGAAMVVWILLTSQISRRG